MTFKDQMWILGKTGCHVIVEDFLKENMGKGSVTCLPDLADGGRAAGAFRGLSLQCAAWGTLHQIHCCTLPFLSPEYPFSKEFK